MGSLYEMVRVLVVEDEEHTRNIIKSLLRQLGVTSVSEAVDGMDGLKEALRIKPGIIFCDIHMPVMDGLTMLKKLRETKLDSVRSIPVVLLTADADRDKVLFAKEHRANGYLVKPVSTNDLRSRLDMVFKSG